MINLPDLIESLQDESRAICFMSSLTFDAFRDSLQPPNFLSLTFHFHSLAEFFKRQADLQVRLLSLNPLSMHWFLSRAYPYIIDEVRLNDTPSAAALWVKWYSTRRVLPLLWKKKKYTELFSCIECFEAHKQKKSVLYPRFFFFHFSFCCFPLPDPCLAAEKWLLFTTVALNILISCSLLLSRAPPACHFGRVHTSPVQNGWTRTLEPFTHWIRIRLNTVPDRWCKTKQLDSSLLERRGFGMFSHRCCKKMQKLYMV